MDGQIEFQFGDGLENLTSGMGTARDKGAHAQYTAEPNYAPYELRETYEASSLIQRAIDMPAEDSCREWREWQAESADISDIEKEEKRLGLHGKVFEARRLARLFGGAGILIGTGDANPELPLDPETVGKGGVKYLTVFPRYELTGQGVDLDIASPYYRQPKYWTVSAADGKLIHIHPSRLVLFHGTDPLHNSSQFGTDGWGKSALPGMLQSLRRVDEIAVNVNSLTYEAKVDVVKIPDFMKNLQMRGPQYEIDVLRRIKLAAQSKGINGTLILDALEEYEQKSASFGGLENIIEKFMQLASTAVGIPMTLFFMTSPSGMNATGESDTRAYYDKVKVEQTLRMQPAMSILDECLIRSGLGDRPEDVHYIWKPLWQPTSKERAETAKSATEAMTNAVKNGLVPEEVAGRTMVNFFTESGVFPGMEGYWEKFFGLEEGEGGNAGVKEFFASRVPQDPDEEELPGAGDSDDDEE